LPLSPSRPPLTPSGADAADHIANGGGAAEAAPPVAPAAVTASEGAEMGANPIESLLRAAKRTGSSHIQSQGASSGAALPAGAWVAILIFLFLLAEGLVWAWHHGHLEWS
jgi:hypothetical protein